MNRTSGPSGRSLPASLLSAARWWVALYALWWAYVGSWSVWAAVWGAGLSLAATVAATVARRSAVGRLPGLVAGLGDVAAAARQVVVDFVVLTRFLGRAVVHGERGPHGRFVTRDTLAAGEDGVALRGWLALLSTYSPNAWVADIDPDSGRALVHDVVVRRDSEEPV